MIFMSQSGLSDPGREAEWDVWYAEHLRVMVTVPGISSAQRFRTASSGYSPSLAMYTVASPDVFGDPYYQSVRGMGEWLSLIQKQHYHRNLFEGLDTAPDVPADCALIVVDRERPAALPGVRLTWLKAAGLDRSTPYRGITVLSRTAAESLAGPGVGVYRPVSARIVPG
jgi:hypothetical protein